jgi:predicted GH43/DUF377 family glycosyl hydrolase
MLLKRQFERLLLRPADLEPSRPNFEVVGVFNPGAVVVAGEVTLLVRVAERPRERRPGFTPLPRFSTTDGFLIDWVDDNSLEALDPRVVRRKADGLVRLTFISHLRVVRCGDGREVTDVAGASFLPQTELEEFGVEDPRITAIGDFTSLTSLSRGTGRRLRSPPRPTFNASIGTGSSSVPRTRTWCCSPNGSMATTWRSIAPTPQRRFAGPRCGSPDRRT